MMKIAVKEFLQYRLSDTINAKVTLSKNGNDWVFQPDHMTLAFTVSERRYCKNYLL